LFVNRWSDTVKKAIFGAGCFWCVEPIFADLIGVRSVRPGYANGHIENPTYKEVCTGTTGHAEVIELEFDENQITYKQLLKAFFHVHTPTTLNRQGDDAGTQYRSGIYYHDELQRKDADQVLKQVDESDLWPDPIVTEIELAGTFYVAESYHHDYFRRNSSQPYCEMVIAPKVAKFRAANGQLLK